MEERVFRDYFVKEKGFNAVNEVLGEVDEDGEELRSVCIAIYCRLALDTKGICIVLDAEMFEDLLSIDSTRGDHERRTLLNALLLVFIVLFSVNLKAIE